MSAVIAIEPGTLRKVVDELGNAAPERGQDHIDAAIAHSVETMTAQRMRSINMTCVHEVTGCDLVSGSSLRPGALERESSDRDWPSRVWHRRCTRSRGPG